MMHIYPGIEVSGLHSLRVMFFDAADANGTLSRCNVRYMTMPSRPITSGNCLVYYLKSLDSPLTRCMHACIIRWCLSSVCL